MDSDKVVPSKAVWNAPLILFTITHLVIIGATYGTLTSEMIHFNSSLEKVIFQLEKTTTLMHTLKESDITLKLQQEHIDDRLKRLEVK